MEFTRVDPPKTEIARSLYRSLSASNPERGVSKSWNPESGTEAGNGNGTGTETSSDTRVGIKFKMASSVIIVLRNCQHSDRDTKGILTFGKCLAKKKVSASYCYSSQS